MKPNKKPEWTFTNPEDRTVQPEKPICKTCFGKNKADRECDPAIPPCPDCQKPLCSTCGNSWMVTKQIGMGSFEESLCPDCQKPKEVIHNRVVYQSDIDLESRITELEQQRELLLKEYRRCMEGIRNIRSICSNADLEAVYLNEDEILAQLTADTRQEDE